MGLVTCNKQGDSLTDWLNNAPQAKKDALCAALGCVEGASYVDCSGNDLPDGAAVASCADLDEVRLPAGTAGQHLILDPSGDPAWVTPDAFATTDSNSVAITGDGSAATPLEAQVRLDPVAGNRITESAAGLLAEAELPPSTPADAGKLLTVDAAGEPVWEDLPPCLVETISASGTLTEDDNGKLAVGAGGTVSAPATLPVGFRVDLVGPVTVVTTGSTLRSIGGVNKVVDDGGATLIKISATEYWLAGAIEA